MKRKSIEEAFQVKNAMISGLWSNSNWDDGKDTRQKALRDIEESYQNSIRQIYQQAEERASRTGKIDYEDPFFAAISHLEE